MLCIVRYYLCFYLCKCVSVYMKKFVSSFYLRFEAIFWFYSGIDVRFV